MNRFITILSIICLFFAAETGILAEELWDFTITEPERPPLINPNPESPPRIFREYSLGMDIDELKNQLKKDLLFVFRGDRDVSFLPLREETLIETTGTSFIRRVFFHLNDNKVYTMAFTMDTRLIDHYSVFTSFLKKYGEPVSINPSITVWEDELTRVSVERPLTVKYIDKEVFNSLIENSEVLKTRQIFERQEFLDEF